MEERVQKLLAQANFGSRRACEELIRQGRVRVNGVVIGLGDKADPQTDVIEVDGERVVFSSQDKIYIALNKPRNVVSTNVAQHGDVRETVRDLVPLQGHLFTIGRLDADSEGLMVLTNDGELANQLTHPRYQHTRTYKVTLKGLPSRETITKWERGIVLEDEGKTAPCTVELVKGDRDFSELRIIMKEGKKRQIRRVASLLGHPVKRIVRTHIGQLALGALRPGEWRELTPKEVIALRTPVSTARPARRQRRESTERSPARPPRKPSSRVNKRR